jgi:hypothetical protein
LEDDVDYLCYLSKVTRVRIVYVVTATTKISVIQQYADFCEKYKIQLTLKELFKYNDHGKYNEIKKTFPNLFYLDNGDYNIYFMPNNTITDKFTNN